MACPHFLPAAKMDGCGRPARLPLGDAYLGACDASGAAGWTPDSVTLRELCNLGYARGRCPRFPESGGPDAVRFCVQAHAGGIVRLYYVLERDHLPLAHGGLEYSVAAGALRQPAGEPLRRQAETYAASYLRRVPSR